VRTDRFVADHVELRARNVHVQPGDPSVLVAAPVDFYAVLGQEAIGSVWVVDGQLEVRAQLAEWREPFGIGQLEQVLRRVRSFAGERLVLPRRES
jgi:hypothetical protein